MSEFFTDKHAEEFEENALSRYPDGHPVKVYLKENFFTRRLIKQINKLDLENELDKFEELFLKLAKVEKRYARKENQLFPYLEKYGWTIIPQIIKTTF